MDPQRPFKIRRDKDDLSFTPTGRGAEGDDFRAGRRPGEQDEQAEAGRGVARQGAHRAQARHLPLSHREELQVYQTR